MGAILTPGYLYWDGFKYVLNPGTFTPNGDLSGDAISQTVVGIQNNPVPTPTGSATVLTWSGSAFVWDSSGGSGITQLTGDVTSGPGSGSQAATVTRIQNNTVTSGSLTKGQFFVASSTSNWAATTLSGDVSESNSTAGLLTITGLQGISIPIPTGTNTVLTYNSGAYSWSAGGGGSVTWADDLGGNGTTTSTNQYVSSLSYSSSTAGGTIAINGTGTTLQFATNNGGPSLTQGISSGSTAIFTIASQGTTDATQTGGLLTLDGGANTASQNTNVGNGGPVVVKGGATAQFNGFGGSVTISGGNNTFGSGSGGTSSSLSFQGSNPNGSFATFSLSSDASGNAGSFVVQDHFGTVQFSIAGPGGHLVPVPNNTIALSPTGLLSASVTPGRFIFNTGRQRNVTPISSGATYNIPIGDDYIVITTLSAPFQINLPTVAANHLQVGDAFEIKDAAGAATSHNVTVVPAASGTIDGAANYVINQNFQSVVFTCIAITPNEQWSISYMLP